MKAYLAYVEFRDGGIEGVVFDNLADAKSAKKGGVNGGAALAVEFHDLYGDNDDLEIKMKEIEL